MRDFEQSPYCEEEQFPTFRISIRTAARLIAEGLGEWNGEAFQDSDHAPFQRPHETFESVYIGAHEFANVQPIGRIKSACEGIEEAIVNAVDRGHITPRRTKRSVAGAVEPAQTYLNVDDILNWCDMVDISPSETFLEYREDEERIASNAYMHLENERFKLENRVALEEVKESAGKLSNDQISVMLVENLRLQEGRLGTQHLKHDRSLQQRERNTLLSIIAALCKDIGYDYTKAAKTAVLIQSTAAKMGVSIGETTIEGHLKKIPDALAGRMK